MNFIRENKSSIIIISLFVLLSLGYYFFLRPNNINPLDPKIIITPTSIPSATPTPTPTATPTSTVAPSPTITPTATARPTAIPNTTRPTISPLNREISIGNTSKKQIALTLDAGSGATQTPAILDILDENNLHITFFITGKWAEQNPSLVKRMVDEGHTIGNHTYSHKDLTTLTDAQIKEEFAKTETILKNISPKAAGKPYFRPPYGARNQHVWNYVASLGYQSIYWTVDALDWKEGVTATQVKQRIYANEKNGAIILMHVGDDLTPAVLQEVITKLQNDGYSIGGLEQTLS